MSKKIAIVEDEPEILANYVAAFTRNGYEVSGYESRTAAWAVLQDQLPDLAIIDINLGEEIEGGFDLCRQLRGLSSELPIIFLTARDSELDTISGLRLGADDYLTKDISLDHLIVRVTALFRRINAIKKTTQEKEHLIARGPLVLDQERIQATWKETVVTLTVTEFWLVHALARFPGHVKSRQQLMDAANVVLDDNTITSHIKRIRKKFQSIDSEFSGIETAYGMGYRWIDP
ncbi:MAG: proteobacterial dedicated sortase system response regulator [Pseudomonadota bacterium]